MYAVHNCRYSAPVPNPTAKPRSNNSVKKHHRLKDSSHQLTTRKVTFARKYGLIISSRMTPDSWRRCCLRWCDILTTVLLLILTNKHSFISSHIHSPITHTHVQGADLWRCRAGRPSARPPAGSSPTAPRTTDSYARLARTPAPTPRGSVAQSPASSNININISGRLVL